MMVFDIEAGGMDGIFKTIREAAGNMGHLSESKEQIINKPVKNTFVLTNVMALEFLNIYHQRLTDERALAFKLLEECIKSLKVII